MRARGNAARMAGCRAAQGSATATISSGAARDAYAGACPRSAMNPKPMSAPSSVFMGASSSGRGRGDVLELFLDLLEGGRRRRHLRRVPQDAPELVLEHAHLEEEVVDGALSG